MRIPGRLMGLIILSTWILIMEEKYKCSVCGKVYDPVLGDPYEKIAPGTKFSDVPAAWCCPVCRAAKEKFFLMD